MLACSSFPSFSTHTSNRFFMGTGTLACWFFAALATVIGIFCSWWTVYSNLYRAVQTVGGTWAYGKYMIHQAIFVVWTVWVVIAPPIGTSSCFVAGVFVMIDQFSGGGTKGATGEFYCSLSYFALSQSFEKIASNHYFFLPFLPFPLRQEAFLASSISRSGAWSAS